MMNPQGDSLKVGFDGSLRLEFHGAKVTSDAGLLAYRDLDNALGLFDSAARILKDTQTGRNICHEMFFLLGQSVYRRLAGYEDVNDAERLSVDPALQAIKGNTKADKNAASTNTAGQFEVEMLVCEENLKGLVKFKYCRWEQR